MPNALFARSEERLNLCVPGGKETARMLKTLYQEFDAPGAAPASVPAQAKPPARGTATAAGRSRDNPVTAKLLSRTRLNKPGSEKETWHVDFDLAGTGLDYVVGDSFGIFPTQRSGAGGSDPAGTRRTARLSRSADGRCARC